MPSRGYKDMSAAMLAYRNRPEGEPEPVKTNWTTVAANDNAAPEELAEMSIERSWRITPSVAEIMRQVRAGETVRNESDQIIRIGKLRFSDGTSTEKAYTYGPDGKLIRYDARMPTGSMLGQRDKPDAQLGGGDDPQEVTASNAYFAEMFGTAKPRHRPAGKRRNGKSYTVEESREALAKAYANTPILPKITKCPDGLPCASAKVADSFVGMKKTKKGQGGAIAWQDIASAYVSREIWAESIAALSDDDKTTLEVVQTAGNLASMGYGGHKRTKERQGMRRLMAANDNLMAAIKKASA